MALLSAKRQGCQEDVQNVIDISLFLHIISIDIFCNKKTMSCLTVHSQTLRARGYRMTPQRLAILEALHHDGHLSPAEIYARVRQTGMTEATVYRTLDFLARNSIIFPACNPDGHLTYELAGQSHHHLICRKCGAEMVIGQEMLQEALDRIEQQSGYRINAGHLTLFGLCPACRETHVI